MTRYARAGRIRRAFERAVAEHVRFEPMGDTLTARHWTAQSSQDKTAWYTVRVSEDGMAESCACPAGEKGLACKHQAAVELAYRAEYSRQVKARVAAFAHQLTPEARRWAGLA